MDKAWLEDYSLREEEINAKFINDFINGKISFDNPHPRKERFPKLQYPIGNLHWKNIWAQLPLYGSSFIPLIPLTKENFLKMYNLSSIRDIDRLLDLAKDTGRIQFVLPTNPMRYADCDFLEPILRELQPPLVASIPIEALGSVNDVKKYSIEFDTIASISWIDLIKKEHSDLTFSYLKERIDHYRFDYVVLRLLGYHDVAEEMMSLTLYDHDRARAFFEIYGNLVAVPALSPLFNFYNIIDNEDKDEIRKNLGAIRGRGFNLENKSFERYILPTEIGKFLIKKLTFLPEGYNACLALIDKYDQSDVSKLVNAIQEGCNKSNYDVINSKSAELNMVFDNLWKEGDKISRLSKGIEYGLTVSFGLIGALATLPIAGLGGILAGCGFEVVDKILNPTLSENLARTVTSSYLVNIFDFKKKYSIRK